jgi:hypothetical protein
LTYFNDVDYPFKYLYSIFFGAQMTIRHFGYLFILFCLSSHTFGQSVMTQIKDDTLSPFTTKAKYIMLTGGALTLVSLIPKHDDLQEDAYKHKTLGSLSKSGDILGQLVPNILYTGAMWVHYKFSDNMDSRRRAILMAKATAYSSLMTTVLKYSIRERRPDGSARNSFPSGHATTIFAFAGIVGIEHEWYYAVPAYAVGAFVSYSRLNDNKHYLKDVVAGATIGIAYAYGVSEINKGNTTSSSLLMPSPDMKGLVFAYTKAFE